MHEHDMAILKALVPVAWADGNYADRERAMMDALLDAYDASDAEKSEIREYASQARGLDDVPLQDLSAADRRVVLQQAVLLTFVDGVQSADEVAFLEKLAAKLRIPSDEATALMAQGAERAKRYLHLL